MRQGEVVGDRFEVERLAARGGMGAVYRARDRLTGAPIALKRLSGDHSLTARFEREARVLADLSHPGIVRYVAHGAMADGGPWLAMEWLDGEDLSARLARGPLAVSDAVGLVERVASALGAAHAASVVHRDVKPSNIFLPGGDLARPILVDFGVARRLDARSTRTGQLLGTPAYMAPEQVRGSRDIGFGADVFSLGCVLFECLTGRPPFDGEHALAILGKVLLEEPPRLLSICPTAPRAIDDLVARMLAKAPEDRPADGHGTAQEIARIGALLTNDALAATIAGSVGPTAGNARGLGYGEQQVVSVVIALLAPTTEIGAAPTWTPADRESP
ncbi:MAG: serine/threonine-protein kinase, partial [Deltaproteobacteria bacterium]